MSSQLKLEHHLNEKIRELENIHKEYQELKDKYVSLEKEYHDLKNVYYLTVRNDKGPRALGETIEHLENELQKLKVDSIEKERNLNKTINENKSKSEREIYTLKSINENNIIKMKGIISLERLCDKQQEQIYEMEDENKKLQLDNQEELRKSKLKHDMNFTELKKKMMDHIKETQKNVTEMNLKNMDVSTKLTMLQNHQLLIELEHQSHEIEDLLKKKNQNEKSIFELSRDLEIHKEVESVLAGKNRKYADIIKNLTQTKDITRNKFSLNDSGISFDLNNKIRDLNFDSYSDKKLRQFEINLKKKETEYNILKLNYESLYEKNIIYEKKFHSVYNLFEVGLNKLQEDEEFSKSKDVYVNIESLKNCDFSELNNEQKYSILMILLKHILPHLLENENSDFIKQNLKNVKMKYHVNMGSTYNKRNRNLIESVSTSLSHTHTHSFGKINQKYKLNKSNGDFPTLNFPNLDKDNNNNLDNNKSQTARSYNVKKNFMNIPINIKSTKKSSFIASRKMII